MSSSDDVLDLDSPTTEQKVRNIVHLKKLRFREILKTKIMELSATEIICHAISTGTWALYIYQLYLNQPINPTLDTLAKLILGAYGAILLKIKDRF